MNRWTLKLLQVISVHISLFMSIKALSSTAAVLCETNASANMGYLRGEGEEKIPVNELMG